MAPPSRCLALQPEPPHRERHCDERKQHEHHDSGSGTHPVKLATSAPLSGANGISGEQPEAAGERTTRGGDYVFDTAPDRLTGTFRDGFSRAPQDGHRHIGFRCAADR